MTDSEAVAAVSALFDLMYSPLVRWAARRLATDGAAEDVVQEAFLSLFSSLRNGHRIENPKAWLMCVVRRESIRLYRQAQMHGGAFAELTEASASFAQDPWPDPASPEVGAGGLGNLLSTLSGREEEVVLLRVKGLKYRQIASALTITEGTVKTLMARALTKMRDLRSKSEFYGKEGAHHHGQNR